MKLINLNIFFNPKFKQIYHEKNLKFLLSTLALVGFIATSNAQLIDEKDVAVTLDLQPVLQLDMTTANQLEFVFDDINEYYAGITQYAATILKVSSSVSWDLYAVGRSSGATAAGFWDQQIDYGDDNTNAIDQLPLSLLELRQSQPNNGAGVRVVLLQTTVLPSQQTALQVEPIVYM